MKWENTKIIGIVNKTKMWLFEKINRIDKSLTGLKKRKREKKQITRIRSESMSILTTNPIKIERIMKIK